MATTFRLDLDVIDPARTLYFSQQPGRGAGDDADTEYLSTRPGYTRVERNTLNSIRWRGYVGTFIAEHLGYDISKAWHIDDFPPGYVLWVKQKRRADGTPRQDFYLLGYGKKKRFSSRPEFCYHAVWLYHDGYHDTGECECTLCTHRPQRVINEIWLNQKAPTGPSANPRGPSTGRGSGGGSAGGHRRGRSSLDNPDLPGDPAEPLSAHVNWVRSVKSLIAGATVDDRVERQRRAVHQPHMLRDLELVWVLIQRLQSTRTPQAPPITMWPAIVNVDPFHTKYNIQFLGVGKAVHTVSPEDVLPWQYYPLNTQKILDHPPFFAETAAQPQAGLLHFHPIRPSDPESEDAARAVPRTYENAIPAYSFAQTVATGILREYSLSGKLPQDQQPADRLVYDSVFYGPDSIWVGDLVRLWVKRSELAQRVDTSAWTPPVRGSMTRTLFVLVHEFCMVDVQMNGKETHVIRFSGIVYELVKAEEDPSVPQNLPNPPPGHNFRPISPLVPMMRISWIAGRYNPSLPSSRFAYPIFRKPLPLLDVPALRTLERDEEKTVSAPAKTMLGAMGLAKIPDGFFPPNKSYVGRITAIREAEKSARLVYWQAEEDHSDDSDTTMLTQ